MLTDLRHSIKLKNKKEEYVSCKIFDIRLRKGRCAKKIY
jgi:hypothetical protein